MLYENQYFFTVMAPVIRTTGVCYVSRFDVIVFLSMYPLQYDLLQVTSFTIAFKF